MFNFNLARHINLYADVVIFSKHIFSVEFKGVEVYGCKTM